jgi:hydroxypyruvate reductase
VKNQKKWPSEEDFANRIFDRNQKMGSHACEILAKSIHAVDPYKCVYNQIQMDGQLLYIGEKVLSIAQFKRIFLIGFGKAAVPMAKAVIDRLGQKITQASVITKDDKFLSENGYGNKLSVLIGGHPIPTVESIRSTTILLESLPRLSPNDLVLVVISGGGSALFTHPVSGVTLSDLQNLTQSLVNCGADISEINTLRKHLDQVKGGRLTAKLQPAHTEALILSDVVGDRLDMIASGPTVPDPTTYLEAFSILHRYDLIDQVPEAILSNLEKGRDGILPETLKPGKLPANLVGHHLVGTNFIAAEAARSHAIALGYHSRIISTALTGRTYHVAEFLNGILQTTIAYNQPVKQPACMIFGGEPTVNVTGNGLGGRNMDLTLRMVPKLSDKCGTLFVSYATDGDDGPTDAAGAVADSLLLSEVKNKYGLSIEDYLEDNDSYHYFQQVGGLIKTGSTGTNVNDLILMLVHQE